MCVTPNSVSGRVVNEVSEVVGPSGGLLPPQRKPNVMSAPCVCVLVCMFAYVCVCVSLCVHAWVGRLWCELRETHQSHTSDLPIQLRCMSLMDSDQSNPSKSCSSLSAYAVMRNIHCFMGMRTTG